MARSKLALRDFLIRHCRILPCPAAPGDTECYVLQVAEGRPFMTESHLREIWRAIGQKISVFSSEKSDVVLTASNIDGLIEQIKIPVTLVESLTEKQAFLILRNIEGIQRDVEECRFYRNRLEELFEDTAKVKIATAPDGDRVFEITGKPSEFYRKRYIERYAEQVASKTLFDVAKALNSRLAPYVPEELREKFFLEGRDLSDKKIRYGEEVGTELTLSDEGAELYTTLVYRSPMLREPIGKLMRQAMTDPFALGMSHYMGKHNVFRAGKRPLVKLPTFSSLFSWVKGLFRKKEE